MVLFYHGLWQIKLVDAPDGSSKRSSWLDIIGTFLLLEFANTGLFITTHDAMHGTICFRWVGLPCSNSSKYCPGSETAAAIAANLLHSVQYVCMPCSCGKQQCTVGRAGSTWPVG
jgi:hypothetical protein